WLAYRAVCRTLNSSLHDDFVWSATQLIRLSGLIRVVDGDRDRVRERNLDVTAALVRNVRDHFTHQLQQRRT
ncbi:MAG: hypothetical protein AAGJ56_10405, partial [Myxococcota bacterium]